MILESLQYVLAACVGAVPAVILAINNSRLIAYKVDELAKKVEKHNNVVERTAILERDMKTIWDKYDDLGRHMDDLGKKVDENKTNIAKLGK